jgi:hypothetical protein
MQQGAPGRVLKHLVSQAALQENNHHAAVSIDGAACIPEPRNQRLSYNRFASQNLDVAAHVIPRMTQPD